jgi:hypothetical protein
MRRRLGAVAALLVVLTSCSSGSSGSSGPSDPEPPPASQAPAGTGARLLAEAGEVLGAEPADPEVERVHPPECPAAYERVIASASYDGVRVSVDLATGPCPDEDGGYFACGGVPERRGHPVELRECFSRALDDGSVLVAGRVVVWQESDSLLAAVARPGRRCVVGSGTDGGATLEELVRVATEIRCE